MSNKPITKFTIDRSKWLNGELYNRYLKADKAAPDAQLKDHSGRMCCLGFYSEACGAVGLRGKDMLCDLVEKQQAKLNDNILINQWTFSMCNDDTDLAPKEREEKIKKLFASRRIKVTFKGKYPVIKK